jgi:RNA polymerase sigma factor (sigma-70 family)
VTVGDGDTDAQLAASAKQGNRAAFDGLVRRHKDPIYRFVRRYIGQPDDAYDVLQNCFIAAWEGLSRYDTGRPFSPWLRVIALNKCRDFGRRQTVRRLFLKAFANEPVPEVITSPNGADDAEADTAKLAALDRAIADLPPLYKEPLLLTVVSGLSHQEAAQILGTTSKGVEMRLYRARRRIQQTMNIKEGEG